MLRWPPLKLGSRWLEQLLHTAYTFAQHDFEDGLGYFSIN